MKEPDSKRKRNSVIIAALTTLLSIVFLFIESHRIDLTTADLGRHITNGKLLLSDINNWHSILHTNYYSYSLPQASFVNHHWASGVLFFMVWKHFDFAGLSVFASVIALSTFLLNFYLAKRFSNMLVTILLSAIYLPLMAGRTEVRPELFSYLFTSVFFAICFLFVNNKIGAKWLWLLPFLELIWVNLHIGFILGLFVISIFFVEQLVKSIIKKEYDCYILLKFTLFCYFAAIFNPNGLLGLIYPLTIFHNYGYLLVENQSVTFLERLNITHGMNFGLYKFSVFVVIISFIITLSVSKKFLFSNAFIVIVFIVLSFSGIRHFPSYAYLAFPVVAINIGIIKQSHYKFKGWVLYDDIILSVLAVSACFGTFTIYKNISTNWNNLGFGLLPGANQAAEFIKQNNIEGPIFNNYDIGSYLIYNFYPKEKVFVDNRPEAYRTDFFETIYKPAQQDNNAWLELDKKYHFNVIFFSHRDYTPWGQQFLVSRVKDDKWAVVYYDPYAIILVKRDNLNQKVIQKSEIPKSYFRY